MTERNYALDLALVRLQRRERHLARLQAKHARLEKMAGSLAAEELFDLQGGIEEAEFDVKEARIDVDMVRAKLKIYEDFPEEA